MNWFLDMCIIIYYAEDTKEPKSIKSKEFVQSKGNNRFLLCFYITRDNMPKWILRQRAISNIIRAKTGNTFIKIEKTEGYNLLFKQDIIKLKKLLAKLSYSSNKYEYYQNLKRNQNILIQRINYFLSKLVDKEVTEKVNFELKSALFTFIQNHSDAMTLASGIQCHNREEEIMVLTADKQHWTKDNLEWALPEHSSLRNNYPNLPQIKYIQDS